jgi:hypothetical protein
MTMTHTQSENTEFNLNFIEPYTTFEQGEPSPIPYVIDGLLTQGGISILGGKSKYGKSSMSRYEAVCVLKGVPFLERNTTRGEVILINLEDPINHVDNCLSVLGYDREQDARIHIVDKLAPSAEQNIEALNKALLEMPNVRLVIIDTLPKFIRVKDLNDYMPVLTAVEQLHDLAKRFPHLHIQGLAHCKKIVTDDPFDALLGSTALRAESDTNIAIYGDRRQKIIAAETRVGRYLEPTIFHAELADSAGATLVRNFSLGAPLEEWQAEQKAKSEKRESKSHVLRIIEYLANCEGGTATQAEVLREVVGNNQVKIDAIQSLIEMGVVTPGGVKQSPTNPTTLHLNADSSGMRYFLLKYGGTVN